jgi:hypothetical protein
MNAGAIILGIIIIIFCYILYLFITKQDSYILTNVTDITSAFTPSNSSQYVPTANTFAYGIWIYLGTWDNTSNKNIITMKSDSKGNNLIVYLDQNDPILYVSFGSNTNNNPITIMNNFPIQKWVHIIVSVDNQYLDIYVDGKLIKSIQVNSVIMKQDTTGLNISSGNINNAFITYFNVWTNTAVDPGTAWKYYLKGNGMSNYAYGADLQILQNNTVQSTYRLF